MESVVHYGNGGSGGLVMAQLSHIKELVRQLEDQLRGAQSQDLCRHLTSQIFSVTERSITLVTSSHLDGGRMRSAAVVATASDACDAPFKATKKRKTTEKKRREVRVGSAGDNPEDDGHSWRKYGQKEILGAKHPRAYYRCTHRHSQGCAATKQVQRADEDPALFDVVYLGDHSCVQRAAAGQAATGANPSASLAVKIEGLAAVEPELPAEQGWGATTPFCLSSSAPASGPLSVPSASDNWGRVSPATSDSNHVVPFPPFEVAGDVLFGLEEAMSALGECVDEDLDVDSFFA